MQAIIKVSPSAGLGPEFFAVKVLLSPTPPEWVPVWAMSYPLDTPEKKPPDPWQQYFIDIILRPLIK